MEELWKTSRVMMKDQKKNPLDSIRLMGRRKRKNGREREEKRRRKEEK